MTERHEAPGIAEKRERLGDPEVRRWYDNLARGSAITADNYLRSLFNFSRRVGTTPAAAAKYSEGKAHRTLLDYVSGEERRGIAGSAIQTYVKAVRSWLSFNGVKVERSVKIHDAGRTPTLESEEVPTQDGLRRILLAANPRQRVAVALVAFSGVRLEVVGNYRGTDGLRVLDLPELEITGGKVSFTSLPARVVVRPELSKTGRAYLSWICSEGAGYIGAFLEQRMQSGEKLGPDSAVFAARMGSSSKRFIKSSRVSMFMRQAIDRAGSDFRPYNLRCYFDTQMLLAESKGRVAHDYRVFWMGHTGSIENRYTTNKGRLPRELIDDMRIAYKRCEPFLSTAQTHVGEDRVTSTQALFLRFAGVSEVEIAKLDLASMTNDEILKIAEKGRAVAEHTGRKPSQRTVAVDR